MVAREIIGCEVAHAGVRLRITEVEAYRYPGDTANHARAGRTPRNTPMWGPPGHTYIYLCYGMHHLLNFVTGPEGHPAAVLIRSAEPVEGLALVRERRGGKEGPVLLTGPGKVGAALGLHTSLSGSPLSGRPLSTGNLTVFPRRAVPPLLTGPRIGIGYALPEHIHAPWRIAMAGTPWVSFRSGLG